MEKDYNEKPGLARRIVFWFLIVVGGVLVLIVLIGLLTWRTQSNYETTAVPYLRSVIPEITTWDPDITWKYYAEEVRESVSQEDNAKIVRYLSRLGALESLGDPEFRQVSSSASLKTGTRKVVVYQIPAVFESGDATIDVTLLDRDGNFSIYFLKFNSMAFLEEVREEVSTE